MSPKETRIKTIGTKTELHVSENVHREGVIRVSSPAEFVVHLEEGSKAMIAVFLDEKRTSSMTISLAPSSSLHLVTVNSASHRVQQQGVLADHASIHWQNISVGLQQCQHALVSDVRGEQGESSVDFLFRAKGLEKLDLSVRNMFNAREGSGQVQMKGVAEESAHIDCRGMIDIGAGGGGTNTYLTQKMLMLDATAKVDAVPGLEIKTDNVKASHSATVSKVSPEDLFYFGSRGIDEGKARKMFIAGFLSDRVCRVEDESLRAEIDALLL